MRKDQTRSCVQRCACGLEGLCLLDRKKPIGSAPVVLLEKVQLNHDKCRIGSLKGQQLFVGRPRLAALFRCVIELSALSTYDGRIEAYDGFDG